MNPFNNSIFYYSLNVELSLLEFVLPLSKENMLSKRLNEKLFKQFSLSTRH